MSDLLFDDHPLMCSPSLAVLLGSSDKAIIIQQIHYWIKKSGKTYDGYQWVYNTTQDWADQFPWLKADLVRKYLKQLEDLGVLVTGNYNKAKFDRTKWYRIDYKALETLKSSMWRKSPDRSGENSHIEPAKSASSNRRKSPDPSGENRQTYTSRLPETTQETTNDYDRQIDSADARDNLRSMDLWQQNWGFPNSVAVQDMTEWINEFGDDLVAWAIKFALRRNVAAKGADRYLERTFDNMRRLGISTVEEAEAQAEQHRQQLDREINGQGSKHYRGHGRTQRVEKLPDWAQDKPKKQNQSAPPKQGMDKPSAAQLVESKKLMEELKARQKAGAS